MKQIAETVATVLKANRLPFGQELAMQRTVAVLLERAGVEHVREYDLGISHGRIDFFIPSVGLGIELKVKGSPSDVMAQLHRYAKSPEITSLMLVTSRARLSGLPVALHKKPLVVVSTWRSGL